MNILEGVRVLDITLAYSGAHDRELSRTLDQDGYATLAARLGFRSVGGAVRIGVYGRNLTDKAFRLNALSGAYGFLTSYAPPRELGVTAGDSF